MISAIEVIFGSVMDLMEKAFVEESREKGLKLFQVYLKDLI